MLLHGRRRSVVSSRGVWHVPWSGHRTILIVRLHVVRRLPIGIHVVGRIHGLLIDMLLVIMMGSILLGATSASRTMPVAVSMTVSVPVSMSSGNRSSTGRRAHVHAALHLLPSRQMATVVHHAGLGV